MIKNEKIPVIGITGGAGSGKSYIAELMKEVCKVYHINTDRISQGQMAKGGCVYREVVDYFGSEFLDDDGEIDRKKLGEYVFHYPGELAKLNAITHPPVHDEVKCRMLEANALGADVILLETALLLEAGYKEICDEVWYVYASRRIRSMRLCETRGYSEDRIRAMFKRQKSDRYFREHADYVLVNQSRDAERIKAAIRRRLKKYQINVVR